MAESPIVVRVVSAFEQLTPAERRAWEQIYEQACDAVPFQSLAWQEAWWEVFGRTSGRFERKPAIFVLSRGQTPVAFYPMYRATMNLAGLPVFRFLAPMGNDKNLTELRLGVVSGGCEREAALAFVHHVDTQFRGWDLLVAPVMPDDALLHERDIIMAHPTAPVVEGFRLDLATDWETWQSGLKRNVKEAIRKCYNRLKKAGIAPDFECLDNPAAIRAALGDFYRLHAARAGVDDGTFHQDYFEADEAKSLVDALLARDVDGRVVRLFVLRIDGRIIAARLAFAVPGGLYLYYSGYEPEFGQYSIATRLLVEIMKWAIGQRLAWLHLSFGRDTSKTRWAPQERTYHQFIGFQKSLRGWLAGWYYTRIQVRRQRLIEARKKGKDPVSEQQSAPVDVSVIIPTYRREQEVVEAINSVLGPSSLKLEVLVMDDTAEATARTAVQTITDPRVRYFTRDAPTGGKPALLRNELAGMARGHVLYFLDDDDRCVLTGLESAYRLLMSSKAGVVVSLPQPFGDPVAVAHEVTFFERAASVLRRSPSAWLLTARLLFKASILVCSCCLVRRDVFERVGGFDPHTRYVEDVEFYLKAIRASGYVLAHDPILERRVGHETLIVKGQRDNLIGASYRRIQQEYRRRHGWAELMLMKGYAKLLA